MSKLADHDKEAARRDYADRPPGALVTPKQPQSAFLGSLDRQTLDTIIQRMTKLEPMVEEYRELARRRRTIESKYGLNRTSERILWLLANHPDGLNAREMGEQLGREPSVIRSTCSDLVQSGHLVRPTAGVYALATNGA